MINIIYSANDKYFNQIFLSLLSIVKHTNEALCIKILTLDCVGKKNKYYFKITEEQRALAEKIIKEKNEASTIEVYDLKDIYLEYMNKCINKKSMFSPFCLLRLLLPYMDLGLDKVLYLDTDTMVLDDISILYNIDITNYEYAAVQDAVGRHFFGKHYTNTGVLLLNLKKIRETGSFERCLKFLETHFSFMPDQDAINNYCKDKLILPRRFNEQKALTPDTVIKHFCNQPHFFPFIRIYKYKQTQIDDVHKKLKIFAFDDIYEIYTDYLTKYPKELNM